MTTKKCEDFATPLNFKKVDVQVLDGLVKEGGIFSASYPTYKIVTSASGIAYEVRRKDADFLFLRKYLVRGFPHIVIPPCPKDQPKILGDKIKKRERYYTRFLQAIIRCEELKTCKFLLTFLKEADVKVFTKAQKDAEKIRDQLKNRPQSDMVTINGVGKLFISRNCQVFCESHQDVTDIY